MSRSGDPSGAAGERPICLPTTLANHKVWEELQSYEARGILVRLAGEERAECWTTPSIAAAEASLLRASDRLDEHDWFRPDALETALANAPHLSEEQAQALRFSANRDGVAICEAPAGTGKTILTRSLVESAQRSGLTVPPHIPPRSNRYDGITYSKAKYKKRNLIERCFNKLSSSDTSRPDTTAAPSTISQ